VKNLLPAFNLLPGLVVDFMGTPGIVTTVRRNSDLEYVTFGVNTPANDVELTLDYNSMVSVIGTAVDLEPDNIVLFNE
jgi:hypothetical protein